MSNFGRNLALWVIIALLLVVLFSLFQPGGLRGTNGSSNVTQLAYSEFLSQVKQGAVAQTALVKLALASLLNDVLRK